MGIATTWHCKNFRPSQRGPGGQLAIIGCNLSRQSVIVSDSQQLQSTIKMSGFENFRCIKRVQFKLIKIKVLKELFICSVIRHCCVSQSIAVSQGKCHGVPLAGWCHDPKLWASRSQFSAQWTPAPLPSRRQLCTFYASKSSSSAELGSEWLRVPKSTKKRAQKCWKIQRTPPSNSQLCTFIASFSSSFAPRNSAGSSLLVQWNVRWGHAFAINDTLGSKSCLKMKKKKLVP